MIVRSKYLHVDENLGGAPGGDDDTADCTQRSGL